MTRIYLDSNIFRYIKPSHPSFNAELLSLMNELKDRSLFIFSDAHLDDLRNSTKEFKDQDLLLMSTYVKDNFFTRNPITNQVSCELATPIEVDAQIDYEAYKRAIDKPFDFDELFKDMDESPEERSAKQMIDSVFNAPLASLGQTMDTSLLKENNRDLFDRMFPGYDPNMSLKDFMTSIGPFTSSLMNNSKEVSELRKYMESYMDSDNYSFQFWGIEFNEKVKKYFGKSFLDLIDGMLLEKQKNDFYLRFYNAYTMLEMYNITEERAGGKAKKFNFLSLANDAAHAYFGSMCDYLITDDKGVQVKAAILYQLFGIQTKILSSNDFVTKKDSFLYPEKTVEDFRNSLKYNIGHSQMLSTESDLATRTLITNYQLKNPIFNFFTTMQIAQGSRVIHIMLSFMRPWSSITLMTREVELIAKKCTMVFGSDDEGFGEFNLSEKVENNSFIRTWSNQTIQLGMVEEREGFILTYIFT